MNIPFIKTDVLKLPCTFPSFKIQATNGNIFIFPDQLKTLLFVYIGHNDDDFSSIYIYLRKYFDISFLSILQIIKNKLVKNVGLNNMFFTASKMELNKIENFKSEFENQCYFLLDSNANIIWSESKPLNTAKKLTSLKNLLNEINQNV